MVDQFTKGQLFSDLWQKCELKMPSNPEKSARKRVQEIFAISWNPRKSELVKLQYNPNDYKWGLFGCPKSYYYFNLCPSYDSWTLWHVSCQSWDISWPYWMVSWAIFGENMVILVQISSYIMARKCIRMRGKYVIWSRKPFWGFRKRTTRHIEGLLLPRKCS